MKIWGFAGRLLRGCKHHRKSGIHSGLLSRIPCRSLNTYNESEFRKELLDLGNGSVELTLSGDGIAVISLSNPGRKNALSGKMMVELSDAVKELEEWKEGCGVILHGADHTFCSGGDISTLKTDPSTGAKQCIFMQNTTSRLFNLPLISVALVEGLSLGGGAEVMTACDFRLVTKDTRIAFVQKRMGLSTGFGGGTRLVKLIGRGKALDLMSTTRLISGEEAVGYGLADALISSNTESIFDTAKEWLLERAWGDPHVSQSIKNVVAAGCDMGMQEALQEEKDVFSGVWGAEAHLEALSKNLKHTRK